MICGKSKSFAWPRLFNGRFLILPVVLAVASAHIAEHLGLSVYPYHNPEADNVPFAPLTYPILFGNGYLFHFTPPAICGVCKTPAEARIAI